MGELVMLPTPQTPIWSLGGRFAAGKRRTDNDEKDERKMGREGEVLGRV